MKAKELRRLWYLFWKERKHQVLPSSSLFSHSSDLLWVNSGVAALRDFFLGKKQPPAPSLVNIQKVTRTNDIDQIGLTNHHLSFFEMMGNFAFGSYSRTEAIVWAWEFLTSPKWLGLAKEKLYFTIYEKDELTWKICQEKLKIPVTHLFLKSAKTNFWDLGVGPCGPNLEIFYDLGPNFDPSHLGLKLLREDLDNDRYLEIWNIVFSEFVSGGKQGLQPLPTKNIDTGAGFERLLMILQKKANVFETELFSSLFLKLTQLTSLSFHQQTTSPLTLKQQKSNQQLMIIVDHLRTAVFLLTDLLASQKDYSFQTGYGYVIRKLLRRAFYQGSMIGVKKAFLFSLVADVVKTMKEVYPSLLTYQETVTKMIRKEEDAFVQIFTNKQVLLFLKEAKEKKVLSAQTLFQLVTTFGLPAPFLEKLGKEEKWNLDWVGYQQLLTDHQLLSKRQSNSLLNWTMINFHTKTKTIFDEKQTVLNNSQVLELIVDQQSVTSAENQQCWILFDKTIFYPQKGGQAADGGTFISPKGKATVLEVITNHYHQHWHWVTLEGKLEVGDFCQLFLNKQQRLLTANNHSATHLLHFALRKFLGKDVRQNGSFNNQAYLRLDLLTTNQILTTELLTLVEKEVNGLIKEAIVPQISWVSHQEAAAMKALDFFTLAKTFSKKVRVVQIGRHSLELCGGTHVENTQLLEKFLITRFSKISSHNYRIYALTTNQAIINFWNQAKEELQLFTTKKKFLTKKLLASSSGKKLWTALHSPSFSYLEWRAVFLAWKNFVKLAEPKIVAEEIQLVTQKLATNSQQHYFHGKKKLIFWPLNSQHWVETSYPRLFLQQVALFHQPSTFELFLVFLPSANQTHPFLLFFSSAWKNYPWKAKIEAAFDRKVKFGIKEKQLKGVFHCPPQLFLTFLQKLVKTGS